MPRPAACRPRHFWSGQSMSETHAAPAHGGHRQAFLRRSSAALARASRSHAGEVHALVGQNGAGKSTLIKILTGAYRADAGKIVFDGQPVEFASPEAGAARRHHHDLPGDQPHPAIARWPRTSFSAATPRRFGLIDWRRMNREADAAAAPLRRQDRRRASRSFAYNTAIQQMVAIARAVSFDAKLVIMDEPTSSLADHEVEMLFGVIRQLRDSGVSVIFVSHKLDELYEVCDRVTVMRDGRTVATQPHGRDQQARARRRHARPRPADGAREGQTGFPWRRPRRPIARCSRPSGCARARKVQGCQRLGARRRDRRARRPARLRPHRDWPARSSAPTAPMRARSRIDGKPVAFREPVDAIAPGIGFCSEDRKAEGIIPDMSVRENLDARDPAAPGRAPASSTRPSSARSSIASSAASASRRPGPSRRSANCPAATSRRCCSRAGCA